MFINILESICLGFVFVFLRRNWGGKVTEGNKLTPGPFSGNLAGTFSLAKGHRTDPCH